MLQVREQQAQEASDAQVADLKESLHTAAEETAELRAQLATVVPREQLTTAEHRIKVPMKAFIVAVPE